MSGRAMSERAMSGRGHERERSRVGEGASGRGYERDRVRARERTVHIINKLP